MSHKLLKLTLLTFLLIFSNIIYPAEIKKNVIVAVVNDGVILRSDIEKEITKIAGSNEVKRFANLTEKEIFEQILEKMILDRLLIQATKKFGINISDIAVENALKNIAVQENLTISQLRMNIIKSGGNYQQYVEDLRNKIAVDELFRAQFYSSIRVSDDEIENFLKNEKLNDSGGAEYDISEFVILDEAKTVPESIIDEIYNNLLRVGLEETKEKYANLQTEINHYGKTKVDILPDIFVKSLQKLNNNEYTEIIESSRGFHILKLNSATNRGKVFVNEYKVRHILMVANVMTTQEEVRKTLSELRDKIKNVDEFIEAAKRNSADKASAIKGGDLGWVRKVSLVKEFSDVMMLTPVKKISDPFQTAFGWHILYVENIRSIDDTNTVLKKKAEHQIRINRAEREREDWVAKLRKQAYIEIKEF